MLARRQVLSVSDSPTQRFARQVEARRESGIRPLTSIVSDLEVEAVDDAPDTVDETDEGEDFPTKSVVREELGLAPDVTGEHLADLLVAYADRSEHAPPHAIPESQRPSDIDLPSVMVAPSSEPPPAMASVAKALPPPQPLRITVTRTMPRPRRRILVERALALPLEIYDAKSLGLRLAALASWMTFWSALTFALTR